MKNIILVIVCLISFVSFGQKNNVIGVWLSEEKDGKIEIYKKGDAVYGKLVWLKEPNNKKGTAKLDKNNPVQQLRKQPLLGLELIKNLKFDDDQWSGGTIYDPKSGKTYDCSLFEKEGNLHIRGYIGWFYQTRTWTPSK